MAYYERSGNTVPAQTPPSVPPSYQPEYDPQIEMGKNTSRKFSAVKLILGVFICFVMLLAVIFSNAQQLQITSEITEKQKEYSDLQSENVRMKSELASKTSNKNIQEYAKDVLGMSPISDSQYVYIQIQTDDVVEIPEAEQNLFVKIKIWFDNFVEYLRG